MNNEATSTGRVVGLQRSNGGVPKVAVERAEIRYDGMQGDRQQNGRHHGGPDRALCLYSQELIDALALEGHPIERGATGENVTLAGVDWREMRPGTRLRIGAVDVELTAYAWPCQTIRDAFLDGGITRISEKMYPGWSRVYARVMAAGEIRVGDRAELTAPA